MDWSVSEIKQVNQYHAQGMFGSPTRTPPGYNVLPLIWKYLIKNGGTKKARCVCIGSPSRKVSVTLDHTYADVLDQSCDRIFWAIKALNHCVTYGANANNAFGEAPPSTAPLYVTIDASFGKIYLKGLLSQLVMYYQYAMRCSTMNHRNYGLR